MAEIANLPTAVLIDGENTPASAFARLDAHLKSIHGICITRIYGDFANTAHAKWLDICRNHGLEPVLHCSPVSGKNGTDILMTIAAMDILAMGKFRRIVLVSNDSDFLALARRLRTGGIEVVGIGRTAATTAVTAAYTKWVELGGPSPKTAGKPKAQPNTKSNAPVPAGFRKAVQEIIGSNAMSLSAIGKALSNAAPELDPALVKGKLKKQIIAAGGFQLEGDLVRRAA